MKRTLLKSGAFATLMTVSLVGGLISAQAQQSGRSGVFPIFPSGPGAYDIIQRDKIEQNRLVFAEKMQKQDFDAYNKATAEADAAYHAMYGVCENGTEDYTKCTGLAQLRQMHIWSQVTQKGPIPAGVYTQAIGNFKQARQEFQTKLSAISVMKDVWTNVGKQTVNDIKTGEALEVYQKGALNLKAFADVYTDGIAKMNTEAMNLTYHIDNHSIPIDTQPGMGLEEVPTTKTPESLRADLEIFQKRAALTDQDKSSLSAISVAVSEQLAKFINATGVHLYWKNSLQKTDQQNWVDAIILKTRIVKYVKAVYCMPIGVPAMDIPPVKKFNLDYLTRGSPIRFVSGRAETNPNIIREILFRFDQTLLSIESQSGKYDGDGLIGFINKVNSTLTWHNEVEAWSSVMNIIREMYQDELDLNDDSVAGCNKVRERYYQHFGSIADNDAFQATVERHLKGLVVSADTSLNNFKVAGSVILTTGEYVRDLQLFLEDHPAASTLGQRVKKDKGLR